MSTIRQNRGSKNMNKTTKMTKGNKNNKKESSRTGNRTRISWVKAMCSNRYTMRDPIYKAKQLTDIIYKLRKADKNVEKLNKKCQKCELLIKCSIK